jgi:hypothetical protein
MLLAESSKCVAGKKERYSNAKIADYGELILRIFAA